MTVANVSLSHMMGALGATADQITWVLTGYSMAEAIFIPLAYSARNRSASIRIPVVPSPKARRIELRFGDPAANPYLCYSAMLMAGLDGIKNKIHPGEAMDKDLYDLPAEEAAEIPTVAESLQEALAALNEDREFLTAGGVFSDDFIDSYITLKSDDVQRVNMATHPLEFELYYSV